MYKQSNNKFNIDVFNSTFNQHKSQHDTQIVEYKEPEALISSNRLGHAEIDVSGKGNYTRSVENRNLAYTDLKSAYTKGDLINPNNVKYKKYKNIDDLERDRANISYTMTPEEMAKQEMIKRQQAEDEELRQQRVSQRDDLISQHYLRVHQNMLGYASKPDMKR